MKKIIILISIFFANRTFAQTNTKLTGKTERRHLQSLSKRRKSALYFESKALSAWERYSADKEFIYIHKIIRVYGIMDKNYASHCFAKFANDKELSGGIVFF
ncbi:MAG: hypothetical protein JSU07_07995 [Bacteroidetes bacterium]|nr:hypothetical protein [Bacteroidota bacterium]